MLFALPDRSVVVTSFAIVAVTASGHGDSRPSPLAILPNRPEASHLLIPLTPYKVAVIDREDSRSGNRGCRELAARLSSPCPQEQEPAHRKASIACLPLNWRSGVVLKTNGVATEAMFPYIMVVFQTTNRVN